MLAGEAEDVGEDIDEFLADAAEDSPNGRIAEPGEVASLVLYLASDAARHITGTAISIDGGATA
jgi:NAD(P)-dependent dehydrogenase (short-subunit alcohol dehydrogenase family)